MYIVHLMGPCFVQVVADPGHARARELEELGDEHEVRLLSKPAVDANPLFRLKPNP